MPSNTINLLFYFYFLGFISVLFSSWQYNRSLDNFGFKDEPRISYFNALASWLYFIVFHIPITYLVVDDDYLEDVYVPDDETHFDKQLFIDKNNKQ